MERRGKRQVDDHSKVEVNVNVNGRDVKVNSNQILEDDTTSRASHSPRNRIEVEVRVNDMPEDLEGAEGGQPPEEMKGQCTDFNGYDSGYYDYGKRKGKPVQERDIPEEEVLSITNDSEQQKTKAEVRKKRAKKLKGKKSPQNRRGSLAETERRSPVVDINRRRLSIDQQMDSSEEEMDENQQSSTGFNTFLMLHKLQKFLRQHSSKSKSSSKIEENIPEEDDNQKNDNGAIGNAPIIPSIEIHQDESPVHLDPEKADTLKPGLLKPAFRMDLGDVSDTDEVYTADTVPSAPKPGSESSKDAHLERNETIVAEDSENKAGILYTDDVSKITPEQLKEIGIELHEGEVLKVKQVLVLDDEEDEEGRHHHHIIPLNNESVTETKIEEISKKAEEVKEKRPNLVRSKTFGTYRHRRLHSEGSSSPTRVPTLTRDTYLRFFDASRRGSEEQSNPIEHGYKGILKDLDSIQETRRSRGLDMSGLGGYHKMYRSRAPEYMSDSDGEAVFVFPEVPMVGGKPSHDIELRRQRLAQNLERDNDRRNTRARPHSFISMSEMKKMYDHNEDVPKKEERRERSRTVSMLETQNPTWSVQKQRSKFENKDEEVTMRKFPRKARPHSLQTLDETVSRGLDLTPLKSNSNCLQEKEDGEYFETNLDEDAVIESRPCNRPSRSRTRSEPAEPSHMVMRSENELKPNSKNTDHGLLTADVPRQPSSERNIGQNEHERNDPVKKSDIQREASPVNLNLVYPDQNVELKPESSPRNTRKEPTMGAKHKNAHDNKTDVSPARNLVHPINKSDQLLKALPDAKQGSSKIQSTKKQQGRVDELKPPADQPRKGSIGDDWFLSSFSSTKLKLPKKKKDQRDQSPFRDDSDDWFYSFDQNSNNNNSNHDHRMMMMMKPKRRQFQKQESVDDHSLEKQIAELCSGYDTFEPKPKPKQRSSSPRRAVRQWDEPPPVIPPLPKPYVFDSYDGYLSDSGGCQRSRRNRLDSGYNSTSSRTDTPLDVVRCIEDGGSDDELLRQKCLDVFKTWHHQDVVRREFKKLNRFTHKPSRSANHSFVILPSDETSNTESNLSSCSSRKSDSINLH